MTNDSKFFRVSPEDLYSELQIASPVSPLYPEDQFRKDCETGNLPGDIIHQISAAVYQAFINDFKKSSGPWTAMAAALAEKIALDLSSDYGFIEDGKPSEKCLALARIILADQHPE